MAGLFDDIPSQENVVSPTIFDDLPTRGGPSSSWTDNVRDFGAGALKIGPVALKGVADITRLVTGDALGVGVSEAMKEGMQSIDEVVGSERLREQKRNMQSALDDPEVGISQIPGVMLDNPRAAADALVSVGGSVLLPAGAAAWAVKALPAARAIPGLASVAPTAAATTAAVATGAAQNAAETFADTDDRSLPERYKGAAISGVTSLALGGLTKGGIDGVVARKIAGNAMASGIPAAAKSALKTGAREFVQEAGEESANYAGKQVARDEEIDPGSMGKRGVYGGIIGLGAGGAADLATNAGSLVKPSPEREIARAIDQAAQEYSDQPLPMDDAAPKARVSELFADLPNEPAIQPEQGDATPDSPQGPKSPDALADEAEPNEPAAARETWDAPEPGTWDNAIRAIQDNKIDLKRVRDSIEERFGAVPEKSDAYLNEELYHGRVAARVQKMHKEQIEPVLSKIAVAGKNLGVTLDDVNLYLHARHAPERNAAMAAINPEMVDNQALSGMSDEDAMQVLAGFEASGKGSALALIAQDVDGLLGNVRNGLVADGLENPETVSAWESAYRHYVPLQRDIKGGTPKGMGFSVRGPESKRAVGSNREVVNILANVVSQAETAAIRAEKSIVGRSLLDMARKYPNPDFWTVDVAPTKPRIDKNTGLVQRNAIDPLYQTADNVIMVKDGGQEHFIVFNKDSDRAMAVAHAMKNLDVAQMNKILEVAGKGTRFIASLLTQRNPLFWLTNFSRDVQGALLNLQGTDAQGMQRQVLGNLPNAFKGMHSYVRGDASGDWAAYAAEMDTIGGTTGYMQSFVDSDARMQGISDEVAKMQQGNADPRRLGRLALEFVDDYNTIIENAVRLSVFQAARDGGIAPKKAASIAKNITVNFNRKGNLTPPINALYMFFNASVQGTARMAQALATSKTAQAAIGGIAAMGFVMDAANRAMSDEDEETGRNRYDLIPEFEKSKNWIFMNPMRPGEYVKVPLPLGPHFFHNAGRLLSDAVFRGDARNAAEYGWSIAGTFIDAFNPLGVTPTVGQLIAPSVLDPVLQVTENKSFTGAPVYKSGERFGSEDPKPAYTRHFESTPDVWVAASKMLNNITGGDKDKPGAINVEPDIFKHVFYAMTGGPGRTIDQAIDSTQVSARGKELSVNKIPLASRFYGANDDQQRERVYYDELKKASDAKTTYDYYTKLGRTKDARRIAEELGDGDAAEGLKKMRAFVGAKKTVSKLNAEIRAVRQSDSDEAEKAEKLRSIHRRRTQIMSDAVREDEETDF